jgi:1,4-dihydroxy-2-naphthoate polyprenyltransferase
MGLMNHRPYACIFGPMRPPFLLLTPACVVLGVGTAFRSSGTVSVSLVILILIGAVCAHISVNAFNEYFDFKSGLDFRTQRTPFSGGSGALPENPQHAHYALETAVATLAIAGIIGIYFLYVRGLALLPLGILGLLIIFVYTPWLTRNPFLCLIAPGLGFGPLMVMGTDFVLRGTYSLPAFITSLVPFFLVSNLLLLNQFPDVDADRSIGRKPFPIVFGKRTSTHLYGAFLLMTYLSIIIGVESNQLPLVSLLGLLTIALAVPAYVGVLRHAENRNKLIPYMALNVITNLATPVLIAIGLFSG